MTVRTPMDRVNVGQTVSVWKFDPEDGHGYGVPMRVVRKRLMLRRPGEFWHPMEFTFEADDGHTETAELYPGDQLEVIPCE